MLSILLAALPLQQQIPSKGVREAWMKGRTLLGGPWLWSNSSARLSLRFSLSLQLLSLTATRGCCHSAHHILLQARKKRGRPGPPCLPRFPREASAVPEGTTNVS